MAVFNAKGSLFFAKPDKNLSDDEWKRFFNQLILLYDEHVKHAYMHRFI